MYHQEAFSIIRYIALFPLLGACLNGLFGSRFSHKSVGLIACGVVGSSFVLSIISLLQLLSLPEHSRVLVDNVYTWISSGEFVADLAFKVDPLSAVMILVVSGVGFLIHIYSVGYMHGDRSYSRYFAYLNLFVFFMLLLVLADNILLMFVGWEGVGLCSYLLIGFWYEEKVNADAGKKAFIVNRIGDFGFLLGIILLFYSVGQLGIWSINFSILSHHAQFIGAGTATAIALLLFTGACGKSAQIPLYVWLPDAMQGPTPVSALIHAATMVTAGVYMVARMNFLFELSPTSMSVVATVGALTALFAASIGLVQNDIKRVLAYSTISQLGYMFLGVGVGAYTAGIFHLFTHAFFKALLFMGAGSVMHALSGETDIRKMGGLKKHIPVTYWTFLMGVIAISGIPGFSGFFSKDEILWKAFSSEHGNFWLWLIGAITAGLTAFYMFRIFFMAFHGKSRVDHHVQEHIHESPPVMTVPLIILASLSIIAGYIGLPHILDISHIGNRFEEFLAPVFPEVLSLETSSANLELGLMGISVAVAIVGIIIAWIFYIKRPELPKQLANRLKGIYQVILNKYYIDEIYNTIFIQPIKQLSTNFLWKFIDINIVDGVVNGVARTVEGASSGLRRYQTGRVPFYAFSILLGAVVIIGYLLFI